MSQTDIAVVGLDCRFPKAPNPAALWELLLDGAEGVDDVPANRWNPDELTASGALNHSTGGFLSDADAFDSDFFAIAPSEAAAMDPQQRLLLQTAWRALEDATLDPRGQAGTNTGVYVGVMANEWAHLQLRDYSQITAQSGSGNGYFMTANRLSYQFDFKGPSMAVDTACSSSLVAVHVAAQALRNGECDQAIAAGVNLTLTPAINVFYTRAGLASPDARCKPFSAQADGIGRGEGVAAVVLRRLDDARAAGLPIYAIIKGSAVNSDGRSNGITAPNRWAQQQVVAKAHRAAGVTAADIAFLEAHGTGTILGDMIESKALGHHFRSRQDRPCGLGSIKGNLGHTEGAAGVAGFVKTVLSLHHKLVPATRFTDSENAALNLAGSGLQLLSAPMELTEPSFAGISSFGIGGTNCHIVVGSARELAAAPAVRPQSFPSILTISSNTAEGLRRNARELSDAIAASTAALDELCWSTNRIKATGKVRAAFVATDRDSAVAALRDDLDSGQATPVSSGWLFSGQGTQYIGMSALLDESEPRLLLDAFTAAEDALAVHLGVRLRDVMNDERINRTEFAQPAIFATQYAQAKALLELGAEPAWLLGHSIGEFAAAVIADVLSLDDACRLVASRGQLMQSLDTDGAMVAVRADVSDVSGFDDLDVAAVNGTRDVVLSGSVAAVDAADKALTATGFTTRRLNVSRAFHSRLMQPMLAEFAAIAQQCTYSPATFPIFSTVHGRVVGDDELLDADYWTAHIVSTVRFADAASAALAQEPTQLVEFGAKRTLGQLVTRLNVEAPHAVSAADGLLTTVVALYRDGLNPDWSLLYPDTAQVTHRLPGYIFDTSTRYWITNNQTPTAASVSAAAPLVREESTMDTLIALFREQAAVLANFGGNVETVLRAATEVPTPSASAQPGNHISAVVRAQVARVSGFPEARLRANHSVMNDLGFDSIMVADLFAGLRRELPGNPIAIAELTATTTVGDLLRFAGGEENTSTAAAPTVEPQFRITDFDEVKALKDRLAFGAAVGVDNPYFLVNDDVTRDTSVINGQRVINFSSYNYLGMSGHPAVTAAVGDAATRWGSSCSASRLLSGEKPVHRELERELASLLGTEDAMALVSGHATNVTVIGHLLGEGDLVIHDSLAHDSIMQGCKLSGATRRPFPHNDFAALDSLLTNIRHQYRRVLIILEGVYSQDGDVPNLPAFIEVKRKHQALLMIDEAHSIGVLGATGGGIGEHFGVDRADVELWSGTMSKALAGCGGYIGGSRDLIEFLKYTTPGFIYSVGMPPPTAAASLAAIRTMRSEPEHLERMRAASALFLQLAREAGIDTGDSEGSPVIPCIVGSSVNALKLSNALLLRGINANPILYPAVPEDKARLRFFVTACHTDEQIRSSVQILAEELALLQGSAKPSAA